MEVHAVNGAERYRAGRCMFRALVQGAHLIRTGHEATPANELELADNLRSMVRPRRIVQELLLDIISIGFYKSGKGAE